MRARVFSAFPAFLAVLVLSSCSSPTGPTDTNFVHVNLANGSAFGIRVPAITSPGQSTQADVLPSGAIAELALVKPSVADLSFPVHDPSVTPERLLGVINFSFVRVPASAAGLDYATIRIVATPNALLSVSTDRPDLITLASVTSVWPR